jgi:hypothetical protein
MPDQMPTGTGFQGGDLRLRLLNPVLPEFPEPERHGSANDFYR